ncbi:hypothetical protein C8R47DRAFT_1168964 [Mycena vitilis]|nr:hypothetical protein C8R47DRAFT_1168964 [Mycena vitilis]
MLRSCGLAYRYFGIVFSSAFGFRTSDLWTLLYFTYLTVVPSTLPTLPSLLIVMHLAWTRTLLPST